MMASSRKPACSLVALLIYLAALIAGGLHQHGHEARQAASNLSSAPAFVGNDAADDDDADTHACAICAAVHQARAITPTAAVETSHTFVYEPATTRTVQALLPFRAASRARAPPAV